MFFDSRDVAEENSVFGVKLVFAAVAVMATFAAAGADVVKSLAGEWRVTGKGIAGVVRLPGTLADAKLGTHKTAADWAKYTDRQSKGALTREYQYRGKAVYGRTRRVIRLSWLWSA